MIRIVAIQIAASTWPAIAAKMRALTRSDTDYMKLQQKGPVAPPPCLTGPLSRVAAALTSWPAVTAHAHWDLVQPGRVDGADYYLGEHEIGHLHLGGEAHIATTMALGSSLVDEGIAEPFRYRMHRGYAGWCQVPIANEADAARAIAAFRRNYLRLAAAAEAQP